MAATERPDRRVKRRIAATAATAAIAISSPAVAARPAKARAASPPGIGSAPAARLAQSDRGTVAATLEASRREEMDGHRRRLAGALAAETGETDTATLEVALAGAQEELADAYSRGERPQFEDGIHAALARRTGMSEDELDAAFEAMSRHALDRRRDGV